MNNCKICDKVMLPRAELCSSCYGRKYRAEHKEQIKIYNQEKFKKFYPLNKERIIKQTSEYAHNNLEQTKFYRLKNNAIKRNINFDITKEYVKQLIAESDNVCIYCGCQLLHTIEKNNPQQLSIDRKDSSIGYISGNLVVCCNLCNTVKHNILTYEDMLIVGKMIARRRKDALTNNR